ncbi:unnamed protein product [Nippostrongylus brasiliensis]|uniref:Tyrosine-protein kinase n=1 Tax=Nippostrongylus brasiliensis TaxID=27835 RepID=A0A0N4YLH1_NIPBR|nr:unnamed protein product [Nippostrongylus brasiliensis]
MPASCHSALENRLLEEDGQFLVRVTEPQPGMGLKTVLSSRWNGKNNHFVINEDGGSIRKVFIEKLKFPNIFELVRYYQREQQPITESTGAILKSPVPKQDWELRHESDDMATPRGALDRDKMAVGYNKKSGSSTKEKEEEITLGSLLGEGAFGGVYAGELQIGKKSYKVAVKVSKSQMLTKRIITQICKEARIMRRYRHRNVVKFYGVAVDRVREPVMLVMEMVDGGALDVMLQKKKNDITVAARVRHTFSSDAYSVWSKRNCLVHRGEVKLSDFGLSRELSNRAKKYTLKVVIRSVIIVTE